MATAAAANSADDNFSLLKNNPNFDNIRNSCDILYFCFLKKACIYVFSYKHDDICVCCIVN